MLQVSNFSKSSKRVPLFLFLQFCEKFWHVAGESFFFCKFWLELLFSGRSVKKVVAGDKQVSYANTPHIKVIAILEFS